MMMRSVFLILFFGLAHVMPMRSAMATDPNTFEVMGLRAGMTLDQVKQAIEHQELGSPKLLRAPSFEQEVALVRKERIAASQYEGVQTLRAENSDNRVEVFFVAMPKGPVAMKITVEVIDGISVQEFSDSLVSRYGLPGRKSDREWLWGDTNVFYARTSPSLEFQPHPVSATSPKPIVRVVLTDPALQKRSRDAIADEAKKGS